MSLLNKEQPKISKMIKKEWCRKFISICIHVIFITYMYMYANIYVCTYMWPSNFSFEQPSIETWWQQSKWFRLKNIYFEGRSNKSTHIKYKNSYFNILLNVCSVLWKLLWQYNGHCYSFMINSNILYVLNYYILYVFNYYILYVLSNYYILCVFLYFQKI